MMNWTELQRESFKLLIQKKLGPKYQKRLIFEFKEIEKQGANAYWLNIINNKLKFTDNPNKLLLPWLHSAVIDDSDPLDDHTITTANFNIIKKYQDEHGALPIGIIKDTDMPDIDIDCLPMAREHIKKFAMEKYNIISNDNYGAVCSVGAWQTFKFKAALRDVASATGLCSKSEIFELTKLLPDEVDEIKEGGLSTCKGKIIDINTNITKDCKTSHRLIECPNCASKETESPTIGQVLNDHKYLTEFYTKYPTIVESAINLIGRVQHIGMHAGAIIIADRSLFGNIPMSKSKSKGSEYWVSMWSEGRNTQLSKFGFTKWDILGLKTLEYIYECCKLLRSTKNIYFGEKTTDPEYVPMDGWDHVNPKFVGEIEGTKVKGMAGYYYINDEKKWISLNDDNVLRTARELKTDTVFQFDTELAKSILKTGTPKSFDDLMLLSAMGHPGPMDCCAPYAKVLTDDGYVEIKDIDGSQNIAYINDQNEISYTTQYLIGESGEKEIFEIETEDGNIVPVSKDHLILTPKGFIKVQDLKENDDIMNLTPQTPKET